MKLNFLLNRTNAMPRAALLLLALSAGCLTAGCGDPLIVLGESPGTVRTVAGIGDSSGTRVDTLASRTRLLNVTAAAFEDGAALLYVADRGSTNIFNGVSSQVARLFSISSAGRIQLLLDAGGCLSGPFCIGEVSNMAAARNGTLVIADAVRHRVIRLDPVTRSFSALAGTGTAGNAVEGGTATSGAINVPAGVEINADGTIYVSERGSGRVLAIGANGLYHVIAGGGTATASAASAPATSIRLVEPSGLALANGVLYIADRSLHSVFALTLASGQIARVAGDGVGGFVGDNGPGTAARLTSPLDVAINEDATLLYIADTGNNRVRTLNTVSGVIQTYVGSGSITYNGDRLAAGAVALKTPVGLDLSDLGFLFVVDQGHAIVRRVTTGF